jgi:hypothetical protein
MEGFVLDCSATMAWCFGDEATIKTYPKGECYLVIPDAQSNW